MRSQFDLSRFRFQILKTLYSGRRKSSADGLEEQTEELCNEGHGMLSRVCGQYGREDEDRIKDNAAGVKKRNKREGCGSLQGGQDTVG